MIPRPGDVLLFEKLPGWHWGSWAPFLIRLVTGNKVTHTGLVAARTPEGRVIYWDSNPGGVRRRVLEPGSAISSNGLVATKIARPRFAGAPMAADVREWAWTMDKAPYSYRRILNLAALHLGWRFKPDWAPRRPLFGNGNPRASICSDFVTRWLQTRSERYWSGRPEWTIEPDDFLQSSLFQVMPFTNGGPA